MFTIIELIHLFSKYVFEQMKLHLTCANFINILSLHIEGM